VCTMVRLIASLMWHQSINYAPKLLARDKLGLHRPMFMVSVTVPRPTVMVIITAVHHYSSVVVADVGLCNSDNANSTVAVDSQTRPVGLVSTLVICIHQ